MNRHSIVNILGSDYIIDTFTTKVALSDKDSYIVKIKSVDYFVKIFKNNIQFMNEIKSLEILRNNSFRNIPELIDTIPSKRIIIQKKLIGSSWSDMLFKISKAEKKRITIKIAKTLSELHSIDTDNCYGIKYKSLNALLRSEYENFQVLYKRKLSNNSFYTKVYDYLLDHIQSDYIESRCNSKKYFVHNDLWSGNIFISTSPEKKIVFCDFERAIISSNLVDISRIYTRGLVSRNYYKPYSLIPDDYLWEIFKEYYFQSITDIENSIAFIKSILYSVLRTINYYIKLSMSSDNKIYSNSANRISNALLMYLKERESS